MSKILNESQRARIRACQDFWLASVKPNPAAHLAPIWAILDGESIYIGTEPDSQKVRNIYAWSRVALALPDTRNVLILEGQVERLAGTVPKSVMARFKEKYDWTFTPGDKWVVVRFTPEKVLSWNSDDS